MVSLCDATRLSRWSEILPSMTARTTAASGGPHASSAPQGEMKRPQGERRFSTRGNGNSTRGGGLFHQGRRSTRPASVERRAERATRPYLCPLSCVLCPCYGTTGTVGTIGTANYHAVDDRSAENCDRSERLLRFSGGPQTSEKRTRRYYGSVWFCRFSGEEQVVRKQGDVPGNLCGCLCRSCLCRGCLLKSCDRM